MKSVWDEIPQIKLIENDELQKKVRGCFEEAILRGGWSEDEAIQIPFTLLIPDCPVSLLEHTSAVTRIALNSADEMHKMYADFRVNRDFLIAGGILHDVGKFLEYKKVKDDFVKSETGLILRHPFSGAAIAYEMKLPNPVVHIIAVHAHEGDNGYRSPEAILVNKADFITFDTLRKFLENRS